LSQAAANAPEISGLRIAKQSIDERFNKEAVAFVLEILKEILERQLSKVICHEFLPQFNRICIKDSTRFNVDNRLKNDFRGSGGNFESGKACVCI